MGITEIVFQQPVRPLDTIESMKNRLSHSYQSPILRTEELSIIQITE
jgi:hypothetical protein